jgi:phosphinothricin acetyltransferase
MKRQNMDEDRLSIRAASADDAAELVSIYAPYVRQTAITFEYEVPTAEEFRERIRKTLARYPYLVAETDGVIAGYAYAGPFQERAAYDWAVETSIYLREDKRGMGIGSRLYDRLQGMLVKQNVLNMNACIAYPQDEDEHLTKGSVLFHKKCGFDMVGEFHKCGYKFDRWYDMVWMEKQIGEHVACQPAVRPFDAEWMC